MRLLRGLGLELTVLGGPRTYWGEERYAVLCAPSTGLIARDELSAPAGPGAPEPEIPLVLVEILADYRVDSRKLTPTARLAEDLGLDSLELVGVVVDLEERLGIELGDELAGVKTLGDAIARVSAKAGSARWTLTA
jgi:acyl carrier protein